MSIAVLINGNARRGSTQVANWVRELLPDARVAMTHSAEDARRWLEKEIAPHPPSLLLSGGGDGTIVGLLNELRGLQLPFPQLGVLPMGTGNAWARVTAAPSVREAVQRVARIDSRDPPTRTYRLVEVEGRLSHFAGTGWESEMISDFQAVLEAQPPGLRRLNSGLLGYLNGMLTRTMPRHLRSSPARVRLFNRGEPPLRVDEDGCVVPAPQGDDGLLYEGVASVASGATTTEWGFGFRAFPFAHRVPGRLSVRVYSANVLEALGKVVKLWRGEHPVPKMHDFLLTHARMEFDREVPLQIGGDLVGMRRSFDLKLAQEQVQLLDWKRLH